VIDDRTWEKILRMVTVRAAGSRGNPQLQILGDVWSARRNGRRSNRSRFRSSPELNQVEAGQSAPAPERRAAHRFHGHAYGTEIAQADVEGVDHNVDLVYLADVTSVTFEPVVGGLENQVKPHKVLVDGVYVDLGETIRIKFAKGERPLLCLHVPTNEAWIVGKAVESLHTYCDDQGVLGPTPCVEYAVDPKTMPKSSKNDGKDEEVDYLHEFIRPTHDEPDEQDRRPVFVINEWGALVFSKDRTQVAGVGAEPAVYAVDAWFEEVGHRYHGEA
jgi:hypothetical protein